MHQMLDDFMEEGKQSEKVKTPATLVVTEQLYLKTDTFTAAASPLPYIKGTVHTKSKLHIFPLTCRAMYQSR